MKHKKFLTVAVTCSFLFLPANAQVNYVQCNAMDEAKSNLAKDTEFRIIYQEAANRAQSEDPYNVGTRSVMTQIYYSKAIDNLRNGIGRPGAVAIMNKISAINADKEKMGCP